MTLSRTHLVILPTYNTGPRLVGVVAEVLRYWQPVMVVVDGSTDSSEQGVLALAKTEPQLTVLISERNAGKGAATLAGAQAARDRGFTHALVMDADGQHPAESIREFMNASQGQPESLVLGRPIFPSNIPAERRHGRKLSIGLVHFELLSRSVADPLFGFRVYPLAPLLAELGPRQSARRYDFDTEAAVRLCWAGVPPLNVAAPVRYFSRAEGGVSHFHYGRDNVRLIWMHTRLITELLLWRWPAVWRNQRRWRTAALMLGWFFFSVATGPAADSDALINPEHRLKADAPAWADLVDAFAHKSDGFAQFSERRFFPFKKDPVVLEGEVRVSAGHGMSLHYRKPEERTVILDAQGMLTRSSAGEKNAPADPRASAANAAMLQVVRFDFSALEKNFELYGQREGPAWTLVLVPRDEMLRHAVGRIIVAGEGPAVRRIDLRRTEKQHIEIAMEPPLPGKAFTTEELRRYFR